MKLERGTPGGDAEHIIWTAQHDGRHEQSSHDAREWLDDYGRGRCDCPKCIKDEAGFQSRARSAGGSSA